MSNDIVKVLQNQIDVDLPNVNAANQTTAAADPSDFSSITLNVTLKSYIVQGSGLTTTAQTKNQVTFNKDPNVANSAVAAVAAAAAQVQLALVANPPTTSSYNVYKHATQNVNAGLSANGTLQ